MAFRATVVISHFSLVGIPLHIHSQCLTVSSSITMLEFNESARRYVDEIGREDMGLRRTVHERLKTSAVMLRSHHQMGAGVTYRT